MNRKAMISEEATKHFRGRILDQEDCIQPLATYSVNELHAMSDDELNKLSAELQGWELIYVTDPFLGDHFWNWVDSNGTGKYSVLQFSPATDRNQSGEMLILALDNNVKFVPTTPDDVPTREIISARAETIAFCAAMLANTGRLR